MEYLKRPDTKQELVSQWQTNFNSIPTHLRREDTMKAELHCTVDVRTTITLANPDTNGIGESFSEVPYNCRS